MSQTDKEAPLSDEQLEGVSGGLSDRTATERQSTLDENNLTDELSDEQLEGVAGGLSDRTGSERQSTLDENNLTDRFEDSRDQVLNQ